MSVLDLSSVIASIVDSRVGILIDLYSFPKPPLVKELSR